MVTGVAAGDVMVAVVIGEHHERFAGLHQCFGILHGLILVILVISGLLWDLWFISSQVSILKRRNQELAMQLVGLAYRTAGVSGGVFLRGAHEAFRVDRVVVTPTGRRGNGHSGGEDGTAFAHGSLIVYAPYFKEVCISSICGVCYQCRTGVQHCIYLLGKFVCIHSVYRM